MLTDIQVFINGIWRPSADGARAEILDPATGDVIGHHAVATPPDLDEAVRTSAAAFESWRKTFAIERAAILRRASELLRQRIDTDAPVLTLEMGKPLAEAKLELSTAADLLEWFAQEAQRISGRVIPARDPKIMQLALKHPVGPIAAFTPWNFPVSQLVRKIAPALAAGCTVVAKPPEDTPASPAILADVLTEAGLPAGVLNLVYGTPPPRDRQPPHPSSRIPLYARCPSRVRFPSASSSPRWRGST